MRNTLHHVKNIFRVKDRMEILHAETQYNNRINLLNYSLLNSLSSGISDERYSDTEIVVSLTTYGKRLHDVYLTIESLMQQTRKANKIVLWLGLEYQNDSLPMSLQLQQRRGLEIRFCKDIRSYTKLIPSLKEFPDAAVITIDDDLIYDVDMVDKLVQAYLKNPSHIYYNRGHRMKLVGENALEKYQSWEWNSASMEVSPLNFPTGVGGVLYPPRIFSDEVFNEEVFLKMCASADDVWFKAMALLNGKSSKKVYTRNPNGEEYLENINVQDVALGHLNNSQSQNDVQIKAVFEKYNLYRLLS